MSEKPAAWFFDLLDTPPRHHNYLHRCKRPSSRQRQNSGLRIFRCTRYYCCTTQSRRHGEFVDTVSPSSASRGQWLVSRKQSYNAIGTFLCMQGLTGYLLLFMCTEQSRRIR
jgi:hypothetical protein